MKKVFLLPLCGKLLRYPALLHKKFLLFRLGFFISWQFGSCFSWVAKKTNVTGRLSSLFFIGCGAGSLATPPLAGFIFTSR